MCQWHLDEEVLVKWYQSPFSPSQQMSLYYLHNVSLTNVLLNSLSPATELKLCIRMRYDMPGFKCERTAWRTLDPLTTFFRYSAESP